MFGFIRKADIKKDLQKEYEKGVKETTSKFEKIIQNLENQHRHDIEMLERIQELELSRKSQEIKTLENEVKKSNKIRNRALAIEAELKNIVKSININWKEFHLTLSSVTHDMAGLEDRFDTLGTEKLKMVK